MKKAFTMLELIFVIIVMGIILAVVTPNTSRNPTQEAAVELQSHIRYAQHLAMVGDKYNAADDDWYKNRWQVVIEDDNLTIQSDNTATLAADPMDSSRSLSQDYGNEYDVAITSNANCPEVGGIFYLSFDHLGRPLRGDLNTYTGPITNGGTSRLITQDCVITITGGDGESATVTVRPETGYVSATF